MVPPTPHSGSSQPSIADECRASLISRMTFSWLYPLIRLGYERQLKQDDIGGNLDRDLVERHFFRFQEQLKRGTEGTFRRTIWTSFNRLEYYAVACKFTSDLMGYALPFCTQYIVSYADAPEEWGTEIWFVAAAMFVSVLVTSICNHWFYQFVMIDGLHARTALQAAVYAKMLRINLSRGDVAATITNLQSTDCRAIENVFSMWMYGWAAPLQAAVTTALLYNQLGWPVFVGIAILLSMGPLQKKVLASLKANTLAASESSDARIQYITEIVQSVQVVKLQAWEDIFIRRVEKRRTAELKHRRSIAFLNGANAAMTECTPIISTVVTFGLYGLVSADPLTATKAFTVLSLFNLLRLPLKILPMLIGIVAAGKVAAKRLGGFLYSPELQSYVKNEAFLEGTDSPLVEVQNSSFVWEADQTDSTGDVEVCNGIRANPFTLVLDNLKLRKGTLTVVTGPVGCGKSSFLSAILGEMNVKKNQSVSVSTRGSISYCAQEPWIQNATLRDNITFGSAFDQAKYESVLHACALEADIAALPGGDLTEIGERGINLSGGQKARVSLARACYADVDVVVLDDVLSAVDAHVARNITDNCLVRLLRDRGKAVVLATHQTLCFSDADKIVVMKDGCIVFQGSFQEAKADEEFSMIFGSTIELDTVQSKKDEKMVTSTVERIQETKSAETKHSLIYTEEEGKLTREEITEEGAVTLAVYLQYAKMMGIPMCAVILFVAIGVNGSQVAVNWWLSRWSVSGSSDTGYYLTIYVGIGLGACFLIFVYQITFVIGGLASAAGIHNRMLAAVLKAPMSFFDTTPSGQILNRFTADMYSIDVLLVAQLSSALGLLFMMVSVFVTMVAVMPYILVALVPLISFYSWVQRIYRNSARELKRFDSSTQSPIFNFFAESANGLSSVRAFCCEERLLKELKHRVDINTRFWTKNNFVNRWLGLRLDIVGAILIGCTASSCVMAIKYNWLTDAGLVGLVLTYTATLTGLLNWGVRNFSEAEMGMIAVERTRSLTACPQEDTVKPLAVSLKWPQEGKILLKDVSVRYRESLPKVLSALTLEISGGMTVGICGRTGSGKTTLAKVLFRLIEIGGGLIEIDGIDISRVDLKVLRSKITMIPQDPNLFAGPLRFSLDPANKCSDEQLWQALDSVGMKVHVAEMANNLDADIVDGGENLSAGQRQLLCMARALLENPRILIMDEATSNIDGRTDNKIQAMLKKEFKDCTILTIAHRIETILWYDKVLVLDQGKVIEFDSPNKLSQQEGSKFRALLTEYRKGRKEQE